MVGDLQRLPGYVCMDLHADLQMCALKTHMNPFHLHRRTWETCRFEKLADRGPSLVQGPYSLSQGMSLEEVAVRGDGGQMSSSFLTHTADSKVQMPREKPSALVWGTDVV